MKTFLLSMAKVALLILAVACAPASAPTAGLTATAAQTSAPPTAAAMDPASVIKAFHDAQNSKNVDAAMVLLADDAVFKNAPPSRSALTGKDQIRTWLQGQVDRGNHIELSNLQVAGDQVTWDAQVSRGGTVIATTHVQAVVQSGKIVSFDFGAPPASQSPATDPASVIQGFFAALKAKDVDAAAGFFADDGVMYDPFGEYHSQAQLRERLIQLTSIPITFEGGNFQVNGDHVTWDQKVFRSNTQIDQGPDEAIVQNGKIKQLSKPPAAQTTPAAATAVAEFSDPWGVVVVDKGNTIKIAVTAASGDDIALGAQVASANVGEVVPGFKIEYVYEDDSCAPNNGATIANRLAANPQIAAVIGFYCSASMIQGSDILDPLHYVMISPSATAAQVTARGLATVNRTAFNDNLQAPAAANFVLNQLKFKTVAVVYDETAYGQGLGQAFKNAFEKGGGTITNFEVRKIGDNDFTAVLTRVAAQKPQLIFFAGNPEPGTKLVIQKNAAGMNGVAFMGTDALFAGYFVPNAGQSAEGAYASLGAGQKAAGYEDFMKKYQALGGKREDIAFGPLAYDAMGVLIKAIQSVAKVDSHGNLEIGRQALANAVRATKDYAGITGSITFDQNGDRIATAADIAIYQVKNGKWVQVLPTQ